MTKMNFGEIGNYSSELKRIREMAISLRTLRGENDIHWWEPAEWAVKYSNMNGNPAKALTITLTPTGCEWAQSGGCTMCGEFEGSAKTRIPDHMHVAQFAKAVSELVPKYNPIWLRINQEGNYANTHETQNLAQTTILKIASQIHGIQRITIESRPRYLTEAVLKKYSEIIADSGVELEIGMGFEAENDVIRNVCINKGETLSEFENAISLMNKYNILPLAYVLLKPPFLTEQEAIDEAILSIRKASQMGFKRISLEPMSLHKYTVVDALARVNVYKVPWLWSVIDVVTKCKDIPELGIGGIGYYPRPFHLSRNHCNCIPKCDEKIWEALKHFGKYRDFSVFESINFDCKKEWQKECLMEAIPLKERIQQQLDRIDIDSYKLSLTNEPEVEPPKSSIIIAGGAQIHHVSKGNR